MYFAPNSILIIVYFFEDFSSMLQPHPALTRKNNIKKLPLLGILSYNRGEKKIFFVEEMPSARQ